MNQKSLKSKIDMPSKKVIKEVALRPISDKELKLSPSLEEKVEQLMRFFDEVGINYDKFNPQEIAKLDLDKKTAYPNVDYSVHIPGQHDTQKWLQAVKDIFYQEKNGMDRANAIRQATADWHIMETFDFLNWIKYYSEGAHLKYKTAQLWYENGTPGYFLHIKKDQENSSSAPVSGKDIDSARDAAAEEMSATEKKHIIEKQRQKIIGRLDSAEKLLRTHEGQIFSGKEFESLLEIIYQLKKKIQMVNKVSSSVRLYEDMIIREANILNKNGFVKAASVLFSVAEDVKKEQPKQNIPIPASPAPPAQSSGAPGGLPSVGPGMPQNPPESAPNQAPMSKGISKFLENLDTGKITSKQDEQDIMEVEDDILHVSLEDDELFITEAQEIPPPPAPPVEPMESVLPAQEPALEVQESPEGAPVPATKDFDHMIDAAFANLTVADVVAKLEDLGKIFKTREVPRQLAIVDMMLDSLGLASYFPSLSEATNKALESNNYISTRVEDILSKLRGSMKTREVDLKGEDSEIPNTPEVEMLKKNLKDQEEKEKARKQMRKEQEAREMEAKTKEVPEVEIEEDLATPPTAPAVPPPAPKPPATV